MSKPVPEVTVEQATPTVAPLAGALNSVTWAECALYGGALVASIPKRFQDISAVRHIPDHQEVWADADTDQSIIIELNSYDDTVADADAAKHYQTELGAANEALSCDFVHSGMLNDTDMPLFGSDVHKSFAITSQRITKFKESAEKANTIQIYMAVVRLKKVTTDVLISFNVPLAFGEGSSSQGRAIMDSEENLAVIRGVLQTLQVKDWGLFGGEGEEDEAME